MAVRLRERAPSGAERAADNRSRPTGSDAWGVAVVWLLICFLATVLLFYRTNYIGGWDWPGIDSVKIAQASGHLSLHPFPAAVTTAQRATESRAVDVVYTSAMAALSSLSGVDAANLLRLPVGICLYMLGSLFLVRSVSRGLRLELPFAYTLTAAVICASVYWVAVLWILNEDPFGWFLLLVSWGLLVRARCVPLEQRDAALYAALWVSVMLAMNYTYPTVMTVNLIACTAILGCSLLRTALRWLNGGISPDGGATAGAFLGMVAIVAVAYTLHPFFNSGLHLLSSARGALATLAGFFHRAGTSRYEAFVTITPLATRLLLFQVVVLAAGYVAARLWQGRRTGPRDAARAWLALDGLFIAALVMPALAVVWGDSRVFEAVAILMPVTSCAVVALSPRSHMRVAMALVLLTTTLAAAVAYSRDPGGLDAGGISAAELSAGRWAGDTIKGPYFADLTVLNPALMENPYSLVDAPVVSQSDTGAIAGFYSGSDSLASAFLRDGYPVVVLTEADLRLRIGLADYPVAPLDPAAVFASGRFNQIYDNGGAGAFVILPPASK